jgi:hypothetical protein
MTYPESTALVVGLSPLPLPARSFPTRVSENYGREGSVMGNNM